MYEVSDFVTNFEKEWLNKASGIEKIIDMFVSAGLPKPFFDTSFGGLHIEFIPNSKSEVKKTRVETRVEMSEKIFALIRNTPEITIMTLVDQIGKSHVTIEKILKDLQKAKKIERVGPTKGGYWKVDE